MNANGSFRLELICAFCVVAATVFLTVPVAIAQSHSATGTSGIAARNSGAERNLAFDVVSIRPASAAEQEHWMVGVLPGGDEYRAIGMPLSTTLMLAYLPWHLSSKNRVVGAPGWLWNDRFDFVGKVGEADLQAWQKLSSRGFMAPNLMLQTMLQNALAERCKLVVHLVPAQTDGFALVVAARGPNRKNLVESRADDAIPSNAQRMAYDGRMVPIISRDEPTLHFYRTSMKSLAEVMSGWVGPVEDKTNLDGKYNFALTRLSTEGVPADWDLGPLGLKLIATKIPTETIVIDHIEMPSAN